MIVKFKRGLQRWPAGHLGSWLKLLTKLDRLTGDDLYRIRAVILFQQQRSGLFGDGEWEWPADDGTGRNPIALLALLFVARRQGDVRLQLYKEGDDQPLLLRSFIEKRVQELLLEIDLRMEGEEESLKWLRDEAKSLLELLVSDFAEGDKKNLSSSLAETVWKMVAHWERSAVMEWCQHFPLDYSDAKWSGLFPEEKTLFSLDRNSLYFHRFLMAEKSVAQKLGERLKKERLHPVDKVEAAFDALPQSRTLHSNQRAAVLECSSRQTSVVTGGPGTGKTTVVAQILRTLMALNRRFSLEEEQLTSARIALVAPTGRAATRLQESLQLELSRIPKGGEEESDLEELMQLEGSTIHRLLVYTAHEGRYKYNSEEPLPHLLVVVDESSMVDLHLFNSLLDALRPEAQLVLIGDVHQLPSVEAGTVLGDIGFAAVRLTYSYRSQREIIALAEEINSGDGEAAKKRLSEVSCSIAEAAACWGENSREEQLLALTDSAIERSEWLSQWGEKFYGEHYLTLLEEWERLAADQSRRWLEPLSKSEEGSREYKLSKLAQQLVQGLNAGRLLSLVRRGERGVEELNSVLAEHLWNRSRARRGERPVALGNRSLHNSPPLEGFHGQPVMVLRNDHSLRIYNGDIGILLKQGQEGALSMLMERGGEGFELIPLHLLPRWESAFAITVHKSQGSEYGEVLLVLPKQEQRLLTREILYTGVTRAKNRITLLGDLQLFAKGCTVVAERESGLKERLDLF